MSDKISLIGANGQLHMFSDYLIITRKGLLAAATHLKCRETRLYYHEIKSIVYRRGILFLSGYIQFLADGDSKCSLVEAATDPRCIVFRSCENKNAEAVAADVSRKIEG